MNNIGTKIKEIRKRKGLSQEELAEAAKVNLRTIQRIENNESEPRGGTLNLICSALDITTETIFDYGKVEDKSYLVLFHLSALASFLLPLGNIIMPLIMWFNKKDKISGLKSLGANVLNFQILSTILTYISLLGYVYIKINHIAGYTWLIILFVIIYLLNIILPVILAIRTHKSNTIKYYPKLIPFIKE
jgi:transcriptional regulator with XRE-family HTH domain